MSERDDLFKEEAQREEDSPLMGQLSSDESAVVPPLPGADEEVCTPPEEAVKSLLAQAEPEQNTACEDIAGGGIASGEVRVVEAPKKPTSSARGILLLLLLAVLGGGGYFLLGGSESTEASLVKTVQRQVMPVRQSIEKQVEDEVIKPETIAVAGIPAAQIDKKLPLVQSVDETVLKETQAEVSKKPLVAEKQLAPPEPATLGTVATATPLYQVLVGPYLNKSGVSAAAEQLHRLGFETEEIKGRGMVTMTRLLEGTYPPAVAREKLLKIKQSVGDAFVLPQGDQLALYVGSFVDSERATNAIAALAKKGIKVTPVITAVEMAGKVLVALQADQKATRQAAAQINASGLTSQVVRK